MNDYKYKDKDYNGNSKKGYLERVYRGKNSNVTSNKVNNKTKNKKEINISSIFR